MRPNGDADIGRWEAEGGSAQPDEQDSPSRAAHYADHTSEIELELRAPTLRDLFVQAGESLSDLMLGEAPDEPRSATETAVAETVRETIALEAADAPALLVAWLEELIYRADTDHAAFTRFEIGAIDEHQLIATLHGLTPLDLRNPIKAATYHGLRVERDRDGSFTATVVLDV